MSIQLIEIEHRIKALREVDPSILEIEERVDYHHALVAALTGRLKFLLHCFNYKTALIVEAEIKEEKKALALCYELLSPAQAKKLEVTQREKTRFSELGRDGNDTLAMSVEDIKRNIRTILFGIPFSITFDGKGFSFSFGMPSLNMEAEMTKLTEFAKTNEFKLIDKKSGSKIKEGQVEDIYLQTVKD